MKTKKYKKEKKIKKHNSKKLFFLLIVFVFYLFLEIYLKTIVKLNHGTNFDRKYKLNNNNNNSYSNYIFEKSSRNYWEKRYSMGGNSGAGSYNHLALYKASILNSFVEQNNVTLVIEWGSGDCNQLSYATYKYYIGYDVSQTAIDICKKKFQNDTTKSFIYINNNYKIDKRGDLSISLDVIYHLLEDDVFNQYMENLFNSSNKYVCIYSSNYIKAWATHVKHRKFTDLIDKYVSNEWKLIRYIPNKYPFDKRKGDTTSFSNFYFYEKIP